MYSDGESTIEKMRGKSQLRNIVVVWLGDAKEICYPQSLNNTMKFLHLTRKDLPNTWITGQKHFYCYTINNKAYHL